METVLKIKANAKHLLVVKKIKKPFSRLYYFTLSIKSTTVFANTESPSSSNFLT